MENKIKEAVEKEKERIANQLIEWINRDTTGRKVNDKFEHFVHKSHVRRKIKQIIAEIDSPQTKLDKMSSVVDGFSPEAIGLREETRHQDKTADTNNQEKKE